MAQPITSFNILHLTKISFSGEKDDSQLLNSIAKIKNMKSCDVLRKLLEKELRYMSNQNFQDVAMDLESFTKFQKDFNATLLQKIASNEKETMSGKIRKLLEKENLKLAGAHNEN